MSLMNIVKKKKVGGGGGRLDLGFFKIKWVPIRQQQLKKVSVSPFAD